MIIELEIPGLPKLPNQLMYKHWRVKNNEAIKWKSHIKNAVFLELGAGVAERKSLSRAELCLTRFSSRRPDYDGLVFSFKHVIDGLVESGLLENDSPEVIGTPIYLWEQVGPKQGKIKVKVEAL